MLGWECSANIWQEKKSYLGWERIKSGPDSVFSFASMFLCSEVQQAAAWVQGEPGCV